MTFWGVEVKPSKPFTLDNEDLGGKLILTQATLGAGPSSKKSTLQVNVGDCSPVYLCTLLPDKSESCSLNLEFDEDDEVKFSVVGPTSIHLSGFVQSNIGCGHDLDSEGEDIDETESESSDYSEDDFDDDLIEYDDDDDVSMFPPSPARNTGVVIEEIVDDEKGAIENGGAKAAKKKKQLPDSDNEKNAEKQIVLKGELESEDEDGFPVSSRNSGNNSDKPEANISTIKAQEGKKKKKDELKEEGQTVKSSKRKVDSISENDESKSDATEAAKENESDDKKKKQKKKKKAKTEKDEEVVDVKQGGSANTKQINKTDDEAKKSKAKPGKPRTYPNGLVIEDLAMGKPDGKRASRGKKISVHYIGKLQKNGKQFDANIGRKPFKFRLGVGAVIKGWDVGIEGMRVGDKRRLTIPPSMGYGAAGAPPQIPPNAWLVFEVQLVDVA